VLKSAPLSGTQSFHGVFYEYLRNDALQGRAFNAITKPSLRFNNFGWNVGGPIFIPGRLNRNRDRLFFFVGGDYKQLRQGATNTWIVPTLAERSGNFSSLAAARYPINGQAFPGGIIPANRISTNTARLINLFPAPNFSGSGGNYVFNTVAPLDTNQGVYKVD
jgi:hypothetical protein